MDQSELRRSVGWMRHERMFSAGVAMFASLGWRRREENEVASAEAVRPGTVVRKSGAVVERGKWSKDWRMFWVS